MTEFPNVSTLSLFFILTLKEPTFLRGDVFEILSFEFEYFLIMLMTVDSFYGDTISPNSLLTTCVDGLLSMLCLTFCISLTFFCSNSCARWSSSLEFYSDLVIWKAVASSSEIANISSLMSIKIDSIWMRRADF